MVADERQHKIVLHSKRSAGRLDHHVVHADFLHGTVEISFDLVILDAILEIGLDPVFDVMMQLAAAID